MQLVAAVQRVEQGVSLLSEQLRQVQERVQAAEASLGELHGRCCGNDAEFSQLKASAGKLTGNSLNSGCLTVVCVGMQCEAKAAHSPPANLHQLQQFLHAAQGVPFAGEALPRPCQS